MKRQKNLGKNIVSLIITFGITAVSTSATNALSLKGSIEKEANSVFNCLTNQSSRAYFQTGLTTAITTSSNDKQNSHNTRRNCYRCVVTGYYDNGNQSCEVLIDCDYEYRKCYTCSNS